jgi:hypothetical protein
MYQPSLFDPMCGTSRAVQQPLLEPIPPEPAPEVHQDAEGQTVAFQRDECPCCGELAILEPHGYCSEWCRLS